MDTRVLVGHAVKLAMLAVLAGLYVTGRSRRCYSIVAYLWAATLGNALTTFWPEVFFHWDFWVRREAFVSILQFGVGVEIAVRSLRAFPGALAAWHRLLVASAVFGSSLVVLALPRGADGGALALPPRMVAATVWLVTITAMVVAHYRIPLIDWHRAVLMGLTAYLFVFTTVVSLLAKLGAPAFPRLGLCDALAYLALMGWWGHTAWKPEEVWDVSPETLRVLHLEHV